MDGVQETIAEIGKKHLARQSAPWTCRDCQAEQPPPEPDGGRCAGCTASEAARWKAAAASRVLPWLLERAKIPPRFARLDWVAPAGVRATGDLRGLCLTGPAGVGKTAALCLIARDWYLARVAAGDRAATKPEAEPSWRFLSFPAFVMELQDAWRREDNERTALRLLKQAASVPYLILDDLGAEKLTDYVRQATYYLVNEREQWERPTYLTTNFSFEQLDEQFDSRISSRIAGMCEVVAMRGRDQRLGNGEARR